MSLKTTQIVDSKKYYKFLKRCYTHIKNSGDTGISRTILNRKICNHTLFDSALSKMVMDGLIEKFLYKAENSHKDAIWYKKLKDMPLNYGIGNIIDEDKIINPVDEVKQKLGKLIDFSSLKKGDIEKLAKEWIEERPDFIALLTKNLFNSINLQELIDMSAREKIGKICELIETEQRLRGNLIGENFTLVIFENASKNLMNKEELDKSKEIKEENYKEING